MSAARAVIALAVVACALAVLSTYPPSVAAADLAYGVAHDVAHDIANDYALSCAGCHGFDGNGSSSVPSLRTIGRYLASDEGRDYLVRVPGVAQAPLDDARLARLLNWVLERYADATPAPFTAVEIGVLRGSPLLDPLAARREIEATLADAYSSQHP